jgi:uncharacterized protein (TIGR02246 family)
MVERRSLLALAPLGLAALSVTRGAAAAKPGKVSRHDVERWIERYAEAWITKDARRAVELFTPDAIYEAIPGVAAQTFVGRAAIYNYWTDITAGQSAVTILHGVPIVKQNRATVELWVTMKVPALNPSGDNMVTLLESNVLYFADSGLCRRNVEYWNLLMGAVQPPLGWGEAR